MTDLSQPVVSDAPPTPKATIAIGIDPTPQIDVPPTPAQPAVSSKPVTGIVVIILASLFILAAGLGVAYVLVVLPKKGAIQMVATLQPQVTALKTSTADLKGIMTKMYALVTTGSQPSAQPSMQTTGIIIHPVIASLRVAPSVLGAATGIPTMGLLERNILAFQKALQGTIGELTHGSASVAGATTSTEDASTQNLRNIISESALADAAVSKAQATLTQIMQTSQTSPAMISTGTKSKILASTTLNLSATPYFSEVKKVADYYQTMSDMLLTMGTKVTSFKAAIQSASSTFGSIFAANQTQPVSTTIAQAQVFLNQADKDMSDMKTLSDKLKNLPGDQLPFGSTEYQIHNVKVLETVTGYFTTESSILQGFLDGAKTMDRKDQQHTMTAADIVGFKNLLQTGASQAQVADAQFVSDLQSLTGEEQTLTISFWQNDTRLTAGDDVLTAIVSYQKTLDSVRQDNTMGFLTQ